MFDDILKQFIEQSNLIEGIESPQMTQVALEAWEYLISQDEITNDVIKKTQKISVKNQNKYFKEQKIKKLLKRKDQGEYRQEEVAIGKYVIVGIDPVKETLTKMWKKTGECIPFKYIQHELDQWIVNANDVVRNGKGEDKNFVENIIKQHHIHFEKIHPFIDGNGRVGRLLLNWQRVKLGLGILIIWEDEKSEYYQWFKGEKKDE